MRLSLYLALALGACQSDVATPFPSGLEPLEDNPVPVQQGGARTEVLVTQAMDTDMTHVFGRGYVLAPPATVWLAAKTPEDMVAKCSTDEQQIAIGDDPAYELSFVVHYVVHQILTVEWNDEWRFGTVEGTPEAPMIAMSRHQKTDGSSIIGFSAGTVEILATDDPDVTELSFVEQLDATGSSDADVIKGVQHNYDSLVSASHGGPVAACP